MATPYDIVRLGTVESTQDAAREANQKSGNPTLVVAESQTEGRGRQGRTWIQPDRALYSSLTFVSTWPVAQRPLITLCTAVALADAVAQEAGVATDIKWPNDLLVGGRKAAGILVETSGNTVTVGCGVNLKWRLPPDYATAICDDRPIEELPGRLATAWVDHLFAYLKNKPTDWPRRGYLTRSWTIGRTVTWNHGTGTAVDIDQAGGLVVETADGRTTIHAGEVHTTRTED